MKTIFAFLFLFQSSISFAEFATARSCYRCYATDRSGYIWFSGAASKDRAHNFNARRCRATSYYPKTCQIKGRCTTFRTAKKSCDQPSKGSPRPGGGGSGGNDDGYDYCDYHPRAPSCDPSYCRDNPSEPACGGDDQYCALHPEDPACRDPF